MKVPTKSYPRQYAPLWGEVEAALRRTVFEDKPVLGRAVADFEAALAEWWGVPHVIGTNSGTGAAGLLYRALGLPAGAGVVTNAHTFGGVVSALLLAGLRPILVDPDPATGRMTPEAVAAAVDPGTAAVLAVHMYGHPEPVDDLADLCAARGLALLEDCAQAHGALWRGRPVGTFGAAAIVSFHPSKNLGAFGDGGAVLTGDRALAARLRVLRNLGKADKYGVAAVGPNDKLDSLQAAILSVKLPHLAGWNARRATLAGRYLRGLEGASVCLPATHPEAAPAWHLFVVRTPHRDALRAHLAGAGVATGLHYPIAAVDQPGLAPHLGGQATPVARRWAAECLTLPLSFEHTEGEIDHVVKAVQAWRP